MSEVQKERARRWVAELRAEHAMTVAERVANHRSRLRSTRWELSPPPHLDDRNAIKVYAAKLARKRGKMAVD